MLFDSRLPDSFWKRVHPEPNSGCWLWTGVLDKDGYGIAYLRNSRTQRAHRIAYTVLVGDLEGLEIDHLCRVEACCNPAHLEPVTRQENATRRRMAKSRCKRGHLFTDINTRWRGGARSCKDCARITGRVSDKKRSSGWERQRQARKKEVNAG